MSRRSGRFYNNRLYKLLSNQSNYSNELLQQLNSLLHEEPDLIEFTHPNEGSYFHVICRNSNNRKNISFRMIYALSNAGADPNVTNGKGNTPLHEAIIQHVDDNGFDLIQALFRVGVDPRIVNIEGKTAGAYIKDKPQLKTLYNGYGEGIWNAIETNNIQETERLVKGFIKVDCKHNSNKTLLEKARDLDCASIIHILADSQVTIEFLHSILACDWDRTSLIYEHESEFLKVNPFDSIHRLTSIRKYSKSLLEYCLDTHCSKPFEILFSCPRIKIDVNILCTDGLPFFFHCFDEIISSELRKNILLNSNMYMKSSKGETFLFHLIHLYSLNENTEYLKTFMNTIHNNPLLIAQRNEQEYTIIEIIEFTTSTLIYNKLRPFYDDIMNILILQLKNNSIIEQLILNNFGYHLLTFFRNKNLQMTNHVYKLLSSFKSRKGLSVLIASLMQAIIDDDLMELKKVLKIQSNIYNAKDSFGRTCAHLAVLLQRYDILKFLCGKYNKIINATDNLNRTTFHYACIMNDKISIEILAQANSNQIPDCLNFYPKDYLLNHELHFEEFHADEFSKNELQRKPLAISNYLKISFYPSFKKAIETNSVDDIKLFNNELIKMRLRLKHFNPNSYLNDYVQGERYIPLLFLALEHRSIESIQCLIELGLPLIGQMYILQSEMTPDSKWISFRSRGEEFQCFDIMDIINDLEDDIELKNVFKQNLVPTGSSIETEQQDSILKKLSEKQKMMNFLRGNQQNQNTKSQTCVIV